MNETLNKTIDAAAQAILTADQYLQTVVSVSAFGFALGHWEPRIQRFSRGSD